MDIGAALSTFVRAHSAGVVLAAETGFLISAPEEPDTVLAPDVAFVSTGKIPNSDSPEFRGYWRVAPDLAVEVASPSQTAPELAEKARRWLGSGTPLVWVVWPDSRRVDVWRGNSVDAPATMSGIGDTLTGEDVLLGFSYPVANLFS
jgi:Uma2 family endonuclease